MTSKVGGDRNYQSNHRNIQNVMFGMLGKSLSYILYPSPLPVPSCEDVLGHVPFTQSQPVVHVVAVLTTHLMI